jgi:hypothetical protein
MFPKVGALVIPRPTLLREQDQDGQPFIYFNEADVESYCEITGVQLVPHQFTVDDCVIMVGRCASVNSPPAR